MDRTKILVLNLVIRADGLFRRTIDLWYPIHVYEIGQAVKFTTSVLLLYIDRGLII